MLQNQNPIWGFIPNRYRKKLQIPQKPQLQSRSSVANVVIVVNIVSVGVRFGKIGSSYASAMAELANRDFLPFISQVITQQNYGDLQIKSPL